VEAENKGDKGELRWKEYGIVLARLNFLELSGLVLDVRMHLVKAIIQL
jgi:hypothetical protein